MVFTGLVIIGSDGDVAVDKYHRYPVYLPNPTIWHCHFGQPILFLLKTHLRNAKIQLNRFFTPSVEYY